MGISTKPAATGTLDKKAKIALLMKHHEKVFQKLNVTEPLFIPKVMFTDNQEKVLGFFESELDKNQDVYVEIVSMDYTVLDQMRTLYKFKHNPHYKEEYRKTEPHALTGAVRYLIPFEELHNVTKQVIKEKVITDEDEIEDDFTLAGPDEDSPISQLTIMDLYAIVQNKPVSFKKFLNDAIKNNQ